jgi:ABC-type oligopeptide transport system substrate-binding subunit
MPGHSDVISLPYNPAEARRLLAEAGYPDGHAFPSIDWVMISYLTPVASYLEAQWQTNLGIQLFWKRAETWGTFAKGAPEQRPTLLLGGWVADYPDPDNFLKVAVRQYLPEWRHEAYEALIEQATRLTDQRERIELYRQADRILTEEAIIAPLLYGCWPMLVKPWVKQYTLSPTRKAFWKDVIVERH